MLIQQVLQVKAIPGVITLPPSAAMSEVIKVLSKKRIGGIVISSDKRYCEGIISERDIVKILSQNGADALDDTFDNYMTSQLISCTPDATADQVLTVMIKKRFRHIPVIVNSELLGLVTICDIVKARLTELEIEKEAKEDMIMGY